MRRRQSRDSCTIGDCLSWTVYPIFCLLLYSTTLRYSERDITRGYSMSQYLLHLWICTQTFATSVWSTFILTTEAEVLIYLVLCCLLCLELHIWIVSSARTLFLEFISYSFYSKISTAEPQKKTIMIVKYPYIPWGFLACSIFITYCNAQYYPIAGVTTGINSNTKARPFRQDINDLQNNIEQWWASLQWMLLLCIISTIQLLIST